ncbi:MAG: hypothetical protein QOJ29_5196 [Thermoleophilaceae bacterium]|nr:hypothetical protein [Thermoleophilaceae bacterium]
MTQLRDDLGIGGTGCLVIAEVAQSHDGSLGQAHAFIDSVARTGADAIKFQTHIAAAESTPSEPWRVAFSRQDARRYDYWKRMEFTEEQWRGLAHHSAEAGLLFLSSAFSVEAIELLERLDMKLWKVASGEVANHEFLDRMASTGRPVLLSSGLSTLGELDAAVARVRSHGAPVAVLQCATAYPCPPEKLGISMIPVLRERYGCPVGLSDHSATIYAGLAAATLGADVLELHVAFSREMFGPDVVASVTPDELRQLVEGIRFIESAMGATIDKDQAAADLVEVRRLFTRSAVVKQALPAGHVLAAGDLVAKKPGSGIPAERIPDLLGRRLAAPVDVDHLLTPEDLEPIDA